MSIAIASVTLLLLVVGGFFLLRKLKSDRQTDINQMEDVPFFVSTWISIQYESKDGTKIQHEDSKVEPYGGTGSLLATREQLTGVCSAALLDKVPFIAQLLGSEFVLVKLKDLIDWQAIYVKTAPDNYVYEFTRGPDYEAAQRNLPPWLQGFRSHVSGNLSNWLQAQDNVTSAIAYSLTLKSLDGEVFTINFVLEACDPMRTKPTQDFEFVTVSPFKKVT